MSSDTRRLPRDKSARRRTGPKYAFERRPGAMRAAQRCARFAKYVILRRKFVRQCEAKELPLYDGKLDGFRLDTLPEKWQAIVAEKMKLDSSVAALNELELIAMAFLTGVADEQAGFKTIGTTFCGTVATHYDIFTVRGSRHFFENVRELYALWADRISIQELDSQRKSLEQRIQETPNRTISPIGIAK